LLSPAGGVPISTYEGSWTIKQDHVIKEEEFKEPMDTGSNENNSKKLKP
jgi:hypothetical protein